MSAWTGDRNTAMSRGRDLRRDGLWDPQEAWRRGKELQHMFCCRPRNEPKGLDQSKEDPLADS